MLIFSVSFQFYRMIPDLPWTKTMRTYPRSLQRLQNVCSYDRCFLQKSKTWKNDMCDIYFHLHNTWEHTSSNMLATHLNDWTITRQNYSICLSQDPWTIMFFELMIREACEQTAEEEKHQQPPQEKTFRNVWKIKQSKFTEEQVHERQRSINPRCSWRQVPERTCNHQRWRQHPSALWGWV